MPWWRPIRTRSTTRTCGRKQKAYLLEWYEAAYHNNDLIDPDPSNNATYSGGRSGQVGPPRRHALVGRFRDLGFRVATLAGTIQPVPALSAPGLLDLLLVVALVGAIVHRPRRGSSAG
jgi:hypothetical protein